MAITFDDILNAVDTLTPDELATLRERIDQRRAARMPQPTTPDVFTPEQMAEIQGMIAAAPRPMTTAPRLPKEGLVEAMLHMWDGLSGEDIEAAVQAMNSV